MNYLIKPGDTLSTISQRAKVDLTTIQQLNPQITDINSIQAGATINLPDTKPQPQPQPQAQPTATPAQPTQSQAQPTIKQTPSVAPSYSPSGGLGTKIGDWTFTEQGWQKQPAPQPDVNKIQSNMQSSIKKSGVDLTDAGAVRGAVQGASAIQTALPDSTGGASGTNLYPSPDSSDPNDPSYQIAQILQKQIDSTKALGDQWTNYLNNEGSLQDYYNNMLTTTAGPTGQSEQGLQTQLLDVQNVMNMSEQDIRDEVQGSGGVATESQIQALTVQRNKLLALKANNISNLLSAQSDYVKNMMDYYQADQKQSEAKFSTQFQIQDKIDTLQKQMLDTQFNQSLKNDQFVSQQATTAMNLLDKMGASGQVPSDTAAQYFATILSNYIPGISAQDVISMSTDRADFQATKAQIASLQAEADYYKGITAQNTADLSVSQFTRTQLNKGAAVSGVSFKDFMKFSPEGKNFFINNQASLKAGVALVDNALAGTLTGNDATLNKNPQAIEEDISGGNLPKEAQDYLIKYLKSKQPQQTAGFKWPWQS